MTSSIQRLAFTGTPWKSFDNKTLKTITLSQNNMFYKRISSLLHNNQNKGTLGNGTTALNSENIFKNTLTIYLVPKCSLVFVFIVLLMVPVIRFVKVTPSPSLLHLYRALNK